MIRRSSMRRPSTLSNRLIIPYKISLRNQAMQNEEKMSPSELTKRLQEADNNKNRYNGFVRTPRDELSITTSSDSRQSNPTASPQDLSLIEKSLEEKKALCASFIRCFTMVATFLQ
jgi:hypothetical protein